MNPYRHIKGQLTKHLLALYRERGKLWREQRAVPPIKLDQPFQAGWSRVFDLTDRAKQRQDAATLETILGEINSVVHFKNREMALETRRRRKRIFPRFYRRQSLNEVTAGRWAKLGWPLAWLCYFNSRPSPVPRWTHHEFARPELFELKVVPRIVTHVQQVCPRIESRLAEIEQELWPRGTRRLDNLLGVSRRRWEEPKSLQTHRWEEAFHQQIRELRDDGVISQALCHKGFKVLEITFSILSGPQAL